MVNTSPTACEISYSLWRYEFEDVAETKNVSDFNIQLCLTASKSAIKTTTTSPGMSGKHHSTGSYGKVIYTYTWIHTHKLYAYFWCSSCGLTWFSVHYERCGSDWFTHNLQAAVILFGESIFIEL